MRKILVVDDSKSVCDLLSEMLSTLGVSVDVFYDGYSLLAYLREGEEPDAVVLDLRMPGKDGTELLHGLRCKWKKTKIFIFSGYVDFSGCDEVKDYTCGFFSKIDGADKLIEAIKHELEI